jgi:hypothetical protein
MKSKQIIRCLAIFEIMLLVIGLSPVGQAAVLADAPGLPVQQPNQLVAQPNCWGLDTVFLVSQSTMSNLNDAYHLRMQAVSSAIDLIGENTLYFCPGYTHRIAVIGFAQLPGKTPAGTVLDTTIETYIPAPGKPGSDQIHPSLTNLGAWDDLRNNVFKPALVSKDLGFYSNYLGAFKAASAQLKTWQGQTVDNLSRRRAVIVIGEGGLCTADLECNDYPKVIDSLNKLLDPAGSAFPFYGVDNPQSIVIYFMGILARRRAATQFFDDPNINTFWTNTTTGHGGALEILQRGQGDLENNLNTDLALKLSKVMNNLLGSNFKAANCQPFWIYPYMSEFTVLHFYRKNQAGQDGLTKVNVTITGNKGKQVIAQYTGGQVKTGTGQVIDYSNPANEAYSIYGMQPGLYSVQVQGANYCNDLDLEIGQTGIVAKVLSPATNARFPEVDAAPFYDQANPSYFRIQLFQPDIHGTLKPLKELSDYPLAMKALVKSQIGSSNPVNFVVPMTRVDDANAIYQTTDPIPTRYPNVYSWLITASTANPRQFDTNFPNVAPVEIFRQEGVFTVGKVTRSFDFAVQNLAKTQALPLINGALDKPLSVKLQLVNPDNTLFPVDQFIAPKGVSPFIATLTGPKGEVINKDVSPTEKSNVFTVDLPVSASNPKVYEPGCYSIAVKLKPDFDKTVFVPARTQIDPISVCLVAAQPFTWQVVSPLKGMDYPLHTRSTILSAPAGLPILIKVTDAANHPLDASLLQNSDKPVFTGVLSSSNDNKGIPINFTVDKETGDFIAEWPADAYKVGQYTLRVLLNSDQLNLAYYTALNRIEPLQFTRSDDFFAQPWAIPALVVGFVVLFGLLIWVLTIIVRLARRSRN